MGWLGALKLLPWSEVIEAAPALVRGARRILAQGQEPPSGPETAAAVAEPDAPAALQTQLQQLARQVEVLNAQQQATAGVVESLTEHNARLVEAVQALRQRLRWLSLGAGVLAVVVLVQALRG